MGHDPTLVGIEERPPAGGSGARVEQKRVERTASR